MTRSVLIGCLSVLILLVGLSNSAAQTQVLRPDLQKVGTAVETYFQKTKPDWRHESVLPATPPGGQPSPYVAIHFWAVEKCEIAERSVADAKTDKPPVSCRIKLAIYESDSASAALEGLTNFASKQRTATALLVGDKGYVWRGENIVFIKDKFTFWLSVDLRGRDHTKNMDLMKSLAKQIGDVVAAR